MAKLLLGKEVTASLNEEIRKKAAILTAHQITPKLGIIRIGEKDDDISYERGATKRCETLGVAYEKFLLPEDASEEMVLNTIAQVNEADDIHGVLLFRPLPRHLNENKIINALAAETVSRAKEDQQTQLAAAQKAIDDAKDAYNAQSIMWDKSEDKSDAEFQSLLAAQKAVTTAEEDYQKVLETTNRAIADAQLAVELDKYKTTDSTSKDKLTDLKEQLADCNITAPCGGVVTAVNVSVGDVNADSKTALVTIEDTSSLKMVATVEEADILKIEEGMKATVTADAMGDETINGTVTRVVRVKGQSTGSDGQTTSGGYSVEISLDNKELLVGMEVKAKVMIKEKGEVLAIPYDLVKTDDDGNTYVLVAEANADGSATAVKKNITVGEEVDYYTEVTGGDLAEGCFCNA